MPNEILEDLKSKTFLEDLDPDLSSDSVELRLRDLEKNERSKTWKVRKEQWLRSRPIFGSHLIVQISETGNLLWASSELLPVAAQQIKPHGGLRTPREVLNAAHQSLGKGVPNSIPTPQIDHNAENLQLIYPQFATWEAGTRMSSVYFPLDHQLVEAWHLSFYEQRGVVPLFYELVIDAASLEVLYQRDSILHSQPTYQYAQPSSLSHSSELWYFAGDGPTNVTPGPSSPNSDQPSVLPRGSLLIPRGIPQSNSPLGWFHNGNFRTEGNNVLALFDLVQDGYPNLGTMISVAADSLGSFFYELDLTGEIENHYEASTVHSFTIANIFHDRSYDWGFDEAAANYQEINFTGQGVGGDPIMVLPQADWNFQVNNAFFTGSTVDGYTAAVVLLPWVGPSPARDSSLDNQVLVHELAHAIPVRILENFPNAHEGRGML
jgi:hypothetical protein